jgi:hypothetical protein
LPANRLPVPVNVADAQFDRGGTGAGAPWTGFGRIP